MNRRFHRWYDRQPDARRFYIFMAMMILALFTPSVAWLVLYGTDFQIELVHVNLIQLGLLLPLLISRMMYRRLNRKRREV